VLSTDGVQPTINLQTPVLPSARVCRWDSGEAVIQKRQSSAGSNEVTRSRRLLIHTSEYSTGLRSFRYVTCSKYCTGAPTFRPRRSATYSLALSALNVRLPDPIRRLKRCSRTPNRLCVSSAKNRTRTTMYLSRAVFGGIESRGRGGYCLLLKPGECRDSSFDSARLKEEAERCSPRFPGGNHERRRCTASCPPF
jgi:hypothetical protein